jgi:hypothetical protein
MRLPSLFFISAYIVTTIARNSYANPTVLPRPADITSTARLLYFHPRHFEFCNDGKESTILNEAFERYTVRIFLPSNSASSHDDHRSLSSSSPSTTQTLLKEDAIYSVSVFVVSSDQSLGLQTSETYTIRINAPTTIIQATTVYGALRALETLAQLSFEVNIEGTNTTYLLEDNRVEEDQEKLNKRHPRPSIDRLVFVNETSIWDTPRFRHRGLLIDTARHYLPLPIIKSQIDAMEMAKLNVLHWHIVDDQSFPYQSDQLPELSQAGAFSSKEVYTAGDIDEIVQYGKSRGVRIVPEFDMPGHTASWGLSHPELLTTCGDIDTTTSGPMDPTKESTFSLIWQLLREVSTRFPDSQIHIGGDEVDFACWSSNKEILHWMEEHREDIGNDVHALLPYFVNKVVGLVDAVGRESMVWQEAFDYGFDNNNVDNNFDDDLKTAGGGGHFSLPTSTVVHVWKWDESLDSMNQAATFSASVLLNATQNEQQQQQGETTAAARARFYSRRRQLQKFDSESAASLHIYPGDTTNSGKDGGADAYWLAELAKVTATHRAVLSAPWYLNLSPAGDEHAWERYWNVQPLNFKASIEQKERVLGGQASVWGELVDETNALQKTWPLAAAVAERLWSEDSVRDIDAARERMEDFRCKLVMNGIPAAPIGPGSCLHLN